MHTVFLICAAVAGTVFLFQFVMLLIGVGAEGADFDVDVPDDAPDVDAGHGSSLIFEVLSLRTIVAAVLFFGLGGLITLSAGQPDWLAILAGIFAGAGAMYGVHFAMTALYRLRQDGGLRVRRAVGRGATVYVPIPANRAGAGKIQIRMQGRLAELTAVTKCDRDLPTGTGVKVTGVVNGSTVEVEPVHEPAETAKA